ncbi:MAG: signal peptidase I [Candidatus Hadarchaeales archaeon]
MDREMFAVCLLGALLVGAWITHTGTPSGENFECENLVNITQIFQGHRAYVENSVGLARTSGTSMEPAMKSGDTVLHVGVPFGDLKAGDIIIYRHTVTVGENRGQTFVVIHRIINVLEDGVFTKGDNLPSPDAYKVHPEEIIGLIRGVVFTSSEAWGR